MSPEEFNSQTYLKSKDVKNDNIIEEGELQSIAEDLSKIDNISKTKQLAEELKKPDNTKNIISSTKDSLKMAIGKCELDSNNKLTEKNKTICKFAYIIAFGELPNSSIDDKTLLNTVTTLQNVEKNNKAVGESSSENKNLTVLGSILEEIQKTSDDKKLAKLEASMEKLKSLKFTKGELIFGMGEFQKLIDNKKDGIIKPILENMKESIMNIAIKNGFTINSKEDLKFLEANLGKNAKINGKDGSEIKINYIKIISDKPEDSLVLKGENGVYKLESLIKEGKLNDDLKDLENINTINMKDTIKEVGGKIGKDKLSKMFNPENIQALEKIPGIGKFLAGILKFFAVFFGNKNFEGPKEKMDDKKRLKMVDQILDDKNNEKGYKISDMTFNDGILNTPKSESQQKYIKDVQVLLEVKDEETTKNEGGKDLLTYGEKTIKAVKDIQKEMGYGKDGANKNKFVNGVFDKNTAKDYKEYLTPETKKVEQPTAVSEIKKPDTVVATPEVKKPDTVVTEDLKPTEYTIKKGDTLLSIVSDKYDVKSYKEKMDIINDIQKNNNIKNLDTIYAGKTIKLPTYPEQ